MRRQSPVAIAAAFILLLTEQTSAAVFPLDSLHGVRLGMSPDDVLAIASGAHQVAESTLQPKIAQTPCDLPPSQSYLCSPATPVARGSQKTSAQRPLVYESGCFDANPQPYRNDPTYIKTIAWYEGDLTVEVTFTEDYPRNPCHAIATKILLTQKLLTVDGYAGFRKESDTFLQAAIKHFGKPTVIVPRHFEPFVNHHIFANNVGVVAGSYNTVPDTVEKRVVEPSAYWCEDGTTSDCSKLGPSVSRDLAYTLPIDLLDDTLLAETSLEDCAVERAVRAAETEARVKHPKPEF